MRRWSLIAITFVLLAGPLAAQSRVSVGIGVGPGFGPGVGFGYANRGPYSNFGMGFGYVPSYYRGFYSNSFSLYGPPVPTYAPVPGMFGGSDQRMDRRTWNDYYNPRDRPPPSYPYAVPNAPFRANQRLPVDAAEPAPAPRPAEGEPEVAPTPRPATSNANVIQFEVRVPDANAQLKFDGQLTKLTGTTRIFTSPKLEPGQMYAYELEATWTEGGQPRRATKRLEAMPGQKLLVDLAQE